MPLTGNALLFVLGIAAIALLVLLVMDRPRLAAEWATRLRRGVQAVLLAGCTVLLSFAMLNDQYIFYTDWADLLGYQGTPVDMHRGAAGQQPSTRKVSGGALTTIHEPAELPPLPILSI